MNSETQQRAPGHGLSRIWSSRSAIVIVICLAIAALVVLVAIVGATLVGEEPALLFRDMAATAGVSPFLGAVSAFGAGLWVAAASVTAFAGFTLRAAGQSEVPRFLLLFAALSLVAALDDFFLLHERVPDMILPGSQPVYMVLYACLFLAFIISQRRLLVENNLVILLGAGACLGASIVVDLIGDLIGDKPDYFTVVEDSFKLAGILLWAAYGFVRSFRAIRETQRTSA